MTWINNTTEKSSHCRNWNYYLIKERGINNLSFAIHIAGYDNNDQIQAATSEENQML